MLAEASVLAGRLVSRGRVGTQPQGDVRWLHRLPDYIEQFVAESAEVRFVTQPGGKGFERLRGVVFAAVEAAIHERLHPMPDRVEQGGDRQGGDNDGELRQALLSRESRDEGLGCRHAAEVEEQ